jgi:glyoxylase-like metal-dependent hydrolase (beta-lactamase superfamily II)
MRAACAILKSVQVLSDVAAIPLPLPHLGSVNVWLLRGDPLTLVDTGPADDAALAALERGLRAHEVRLEDIEQVLATHHHLDHVGLAAAIQERSGARLAVLDAVADYGARYAERVGEERAFSRELMATHGVPAAVIDDNEDFWEFIGRNSRDFRADVRLRDGDRIRAGGRTLRVVARPGHSATDVLLVDDAEQLAFVGDHLLAGISSNTEIYPLAGSDGGGVAGSDGGGFAGSEAGRLAGSDGGGVAGSENGRVAGSEAARLAGSNVARPPARVVYLESLRRTARMPLRRLLTGHGPEVTEHARLVGERRAEHRRRCADITRALEGGEATAYDLAGQLWSPRTVTRQALLVVWEVLGHLDLLAAAGTVRERVGDDGRARFALVQDAPSDAPLAHVN